MNLAAVTLLPAFAENRTWYRVAGTRWVRSAIATAHTVVTSSRFYDPYTATPQFPTLYLADSPLVAMFEAMALLGSPAIPGGPVPAPRGSWTILTVRVQLRAILDLSSLGAQSALDISAQELTGDWQGYRMRSRSTNVAVPIGTAPTQMLGEAVHSDPRGLEGFTTVSAKVTANRNLVVFPDHLFPGSFIEYDWDDGEHVYRIDTDDPNGRELR
jgi:hypothetical protein